jgi:flavin reductase (DIM6/NTAB) family NADH-FMN oxidoreductase RutF
MIKTIAPGSIPTAQLHRLILGAVAPRPIAFASTIDKAGNPNLSPFSFFNAFGVNPTTLIFSPSRRGRDNTNKHTYENIREIPEVVINVVNYDMVQQMSLASCEYPKGVNEFEKSGFTAIASETIRPFRVKESPVQFECKVRQVIETGDGGGAANLVICEITMIHIHDGILDENGIPDPNKIRLIGRHTGDFYVKAYGESLFVVEKPAAKLGIGIDALPSKIKNSNRLTGNNLGQLGNCENFPTLEDISSVASLPEVKKIINTHKNDQAILARELQILAKKWLDESRVKEAFCVLLIETKDFID